MIGFETIYIDMVASKLTVMGEFNPTAVAKKLKKAGVYEDIQFIRPVNKVMISCLKLEKNLNYDQFINLDI